MTQTSTPAQLIGKCRNGHTIHGECRLGRNVATTPGAAVELYDVFVCPCGARAAVRFMNVKLVAEKVCNGVCMGAQGPSCSCSCGGKNHGANHIYG